MTRGAALPDALLCVAIGLLLADRSRRETVLCARLLVGVGLATKAIGFNGLSDDVAFTGCWLSVLVTAGGVHLAGRLPTLAVRGLALNAGLWCGLAAEVGGGWEKLLIGLPFVAASVPARLLLKAGYGISLRVVASWLMAIAGLESILPLLPTPGYRGDHLD